MSAEGRDRGTWQVGGDVGRPEHDDDLTALLESQGQADLLASLDRLDDSLTTWEESTADDVLDEGLEARLDAVSGADTAPLAWRSLHRRVHDGATSWAVFWVDPAREEGGPALVSGVLREEVAALPALMEQVRRAVQETRRPPG